MCRRACLQCRDKFLCVGDVYFGWSACFNVHYLSLAFQTCRNDNPYLLEVLDEKEVRRFFF